MADETDLFGIPVPSTDPVFIFIIIIHIGIGLLCVVSGLVSLSEKTKKKRRSNWRQESYNGSYCPVQWLDKK